MRPAHPYVTNAQRELIEHLFVINDYWNKDIVEEGRHRFHTRIGNLSIDEIYYIGREFGIVLDNYIGEEVYIHGSIIKKQCD